MTEELSTIKWTIRSEDAGERLDKTVSKYLKSLGQENESFSRSQLARWIREGSVRVRGQVICKPSFILPEQGVIEVAVPARKLSKLQPDADVSFDILYEDQHLLVIDKPAGVVVHPGAGRGGSTLVHGLLHRIGERLRGVGDELRPGIVHRLDRNTSGLMLVAKTQLAHNALAEQFRNRSIEKTYLALTYRKPGKGADGVIEKPLGRNPLKRKKMAVVTSGGRYAKTLWKVREELKYGYLLEVQIETGRTHQIRVHLQSGGAAVVGDSDYGSTPRELPKLLKSQIQKCGRQALHAWRLTFRHPVSGERTTFEAPLPEDLEQLVATFRSS